MNDENNQRNRTAHYNIMTSCDRNLIKYIPIQIVSLLAAMPDASVDFYLFHRDMDETDLAELNAVCRAVETIRFHSVQVREPEKYDSIAEGQNRWGGEAYYSLCASQYLPDTEDRVLYIDAGDVLIVDDIAPYYTAPFDGKMLIVTPSQYKFISIPLEDGRSTLAALPWEKSDLETHYREIIRCPSLFNSGCYVINLEKMRQTGLSIDYYLSFSAELRRKFPYVCDENSTVRYTYHGDQGFLSGVFLGDMKMFEREDGYLDLSYVPYNFLPGYYFSRPHEPPYIPAVVHYVSTNIIKPWNFPFLEFLPRFCSPVACPDTLRLPNFHLIENWYQLWFITAQQTDRLLTALGF